MGNRYGPWHLKWSDQFCTYMNLHSFKINVQDAFKSFKVVIRTLETLKNAFRYRFGLINDTV